MNVAVSTYTRPSGSDPYTEDAELSALFGNTQVLPIPGYPIDYSGVDYVLSGVQTAIGDFGNGELQQRVFIYLTKV